MQPYLNRRRRFLKEVHVRVGVLQHIFDVFPCTLTVTFFSEFYMYVLFLPIRATDLSVLIL